ncbi:MAG: class I SAM-dependent methyltransferase [Rhodoplanes sp.]|uniref:class I SAM-dependent methyltransferase n=1 Tax=Rhodoplanes sp. TaxID=1968906 RepID=UPI00184F6486|nr:class I SAM-dependent methyltransferase [Rhodoplanes sp.]NVO17952.1 class I SAM-dependent methyltransferase [Rhodoplanes sp.]
MKPVCRSCGTPLETTFVDLGMSPLANSLLKPEHGNDMERFYPLHVFVCSQCFLVQLEEFESPEHIFSDYLYFSSFSDAWLRHCSAYADKVEARLGLGPTSKVVEVASNDGYLLQFFAKKGIPVLGIEPAANVAQTAIGKGIQTEVAFFGRQTAERLRDAHSADLIAANNVLAHVPDINDFVAGFKALLKPDGTITVEFPHLLQLIRHRQYDTIYHEHFSYLSLLAIEAVFGRHGLALYDVEELPTHGGSLRIYASHQEAGRAASPALLAVRVAERAAGLDRLDTYRDFAATVALSKCDILEFFIKARREGKTVAGYAAAAKGNTLLNYCGIGKEFISYVVDRNPHKQGRLLPGTHIPVYGPEQIAQTKPDYLFILAWNLRDEVVSQMHEIRGWGGKFVVPIPNLDVF